MSLEQGNCASLAAEGEDKRWYQQYLPYSRALAIGTNRGSSFLQDEAQACQMPGQARAGMRGLRMRCGG